MRHDESSAARNTALLIVAASVIVLLAVTGCGPTLNIDGTWSGILETTFACGFLPGFVQLQIEEGTFKVVDSWNPYSFLPGTTGTIEPFNGNWADGRFHVMFTNGGPRYGILVVDAEAGHAEFIVESDRYDPESPTREGYVGLLQLGEEQTATFAETDLIGSWAGVSVRVSGMFDVTSNSASEATITNPDGLAMTGSFGEGFFSVSAGDINPVAGYQESGVSRTDDQLNMPGDLTYDAIYVLSPDKEYLAVGFLDDTCSETIFTRLPDQVFSLWTRQQVVRLGRDHNLSRHRFGRV
jgi:hypothetical protein